jgi:hypothetical protein
MRKNVLITSICMLSIAMFTGCNEEEVALTGISIDKEALNVLLGFREQVVANPIPDNASADFEWVSENPEVATVTRFGIVEAVEEGTTNIIVKSGSFQKTISVTVTDPVVIPAKVGFWSFDDAANLAKAEIGQALQLEGSGFTAISGPSSTNKAVKVDKGSYFKATHGIPLSTTPLGNRALTYTLMFDFQIPATGSWYTFYQTDVNNSGDGEIFINTSGKIGVGTTGYTEAAVPTGVWNRFVVTVATTDVATTSVKVDYYLNGTSILTWSGAHERFWLEDVVLLLGDNDGDDADIDVAAIALWDTAFDNLQIAKLQRTEDKLQ